MWSLRTAEIAIQPGRARMASVSTFMPHHEARMTSGSRADNGGGIDDTILRFAAVAQFGEDGIAAGDFDQLFDPADAADQRVVPLLEVNTRAAREFRRLNLRSRSRPLCNFSMSAAPSVRFADDAREHGDHVEDLRDGSLVEVEDSCAAQDEVAGDFGLDVGEGEDEVGLEVEDGFDVGIAKCRDAWLGARLAAGALHSRRRRRCDPARRAGRGFRRFRR